MTFDSRFCEDMFDTLGRDHTLRHAYRVYLWRRALELVHHSPTDEGATAGADLCSAVQAFIPPSDRSNRLNAERALSSLWGTQN
jgi:hypothetical protein